MCTTGQVPERPTVRVGVMEITSAARCRVVDSQTQRMGCACVQALLPSHPLVAEISACYIHPGRGEYVSCEDHIKGNALAYRGYCRLLNEEEFYYVDLSELSVLIALLEIDALILRYRIIHIR